MVMVGAGRVATHLATALHQCGVRWAQVYSRTPESASQLAQRVGAEAVHRIEDLCLDADLYLVSLTDEALMQLAGPLTRGRTSGLWVHTAGSVPMQLFAGKALRYGVLYPMQTFSKEREVDFSEVSLFVEACTESDLALLQQLASSLTRRVYRADSNQRKALHLAAVLTCNFVNHLYALSAEWLQQHGLPFEAMLPLIDETARKVHQLPPCEAQTGPAARGDRKVVDAHLQLLEGNPYLQQLYREMSGGINPGLFQG